MNLSMAEFGRRIGYSPTHVKRLEEGTSPVSEECVHRICDVFKVDPQYFTSDLPIEEAMADMGATVDESLPEADETPVYDGRAPERIKSLRTEVGLSQRQFALKAGVNNSLISEVEAGNRELSLKAAKKIEDAFEVGHEWLLYGDSEKKDFPVSDRLIECLWKDEEVRRELWTWMKDKNQEEPRKPKEPKEPNEPKEPREQLKDDGLDYEAIGRKLRELRISRNLTQSMVADALDYSPAQVCRIERGMKGSNVRNLDVLERYAEFYDVSVIEIIDAGL